MSITVYQTNNTIVKKVIVGTPIRSIVQSSGQLERLFDVDINNLNNGDYLKYDSASGKWINYVGLDSDIRNLLGASGDLSYDPTTGLFSIDVEVQYTKANFDSDLSISSTSNLPEGSRLYYTDDRVQTKLANVSGHIIPDTDLAYDLGDSAHRFRSLFIGAETINLGDNVSISEVDGRLVVTDTNGTLSIPSTTTQLSEGSNLYYTTARADSDARNALSASGDLSYDPTTGIFQFDVENVYTKANFDSDLTISSTSNLPEGSRLYYTSTRADSDFDIRLATKSTTNLAEGSNLYYTLARDDSAFDVRLATKTTTNLAEGSNLYYTSTRADSDFDTRLVTKSTTNLAEGSNLYYTSTRADSDFDIRLVTKSTTNLAEGSNLYYTSTRADSDFDIRLVTKSTDDLAEGSNLYYTLVRDDSAFDVRLATKTTDNITEGDNLYYTTTRADSDFDTRLATKTTDNITEGDNLYYTLARADSAIDVKITQAYIKATGITLDDVTDNNATTTNTVTIGQLNTTGGIVQHTPAVAATISSDSITLIDATVHNSGFTSIEYLVQINNDSASETQISKITAAFNKTVVSISEFGIVHTGDSDLGAFTSDVSGGDIRLFFQRRPSNTITLKSTKIIIQ
jgi:hypothetical protein